MKTFQNDVGDISLNFVCGIDEAGRGCLAGPVFAAAVVLPDGFPVEILNDSKKLSPKKRDAAAAVIKSRSAFGIASASHVEIDQINILQATLLAMRRAFEAMRNDFPDILPQQVIVDGNKSPDIPCANAVVKADATVPAVMAASILAKTARDAFMTCAALSYPEYGYEIHKGYPTPAHKKICRELGPSPIQRLTFRY